MKTDFVLIVWGDTYTGYFLDYSLPTLLSPNNLPAWPPADARVVIYTTPESQARIAPAPATQHLAALMPVVYQPLEMPPVIDGQVDNYRHMSIYNSHSFAEARARGAGVVILVPDALFSDGSFTHLASLVGRREYVMLCGYHVTQEDILPRLQRDPDSCAINLSVADCWHLINTCMHAGMRARFWDAPYFHWWPSHIYHRMPDGSIEAHCYHLHPIYLRNPHPEVDIREMKVPSYDGDYMSMHYDRREEGEIITDSSMIGIGWVPRQKIEEVGKACDLAERERIRDHFDRELAQPIHRYFFEHAVILKAPEA